MDMPKYQIKIYQKVLEGRKEYKSVINTNKNGNNYMHVFNDQHKWFIYIVT